MNLFVSQVVSLLTRGRHAGDAALAVNDPVLVVLPRTLGLRSDAFAHRGAMACAQAGKGIGDNRSPALAWNSLPPGATDWLLVVEDPDAPRKAAWVHVVVAGPAAMTRLVKGALKPSRAPAGLRFGRNTAGDAGYGGPRPLPGHGPHRYVFQLFALRATPPDDLLARGRDALVPFLREHALASGRLDGLFQRDWRGRPIAPPPRPRKRRRRTRASKPAA
jgi:Raf kinase inhibitor-like YbhB/YbcL family protein